MFVQRLPNLTSRTSIVPVTQSASLAASTVGSSMISSTSILGPTPSKSIIPAASLAPVYAYTSLPWNV